MVASLKIASLAAAALVLAQPAAAQSCDSEIARLAAQFGLAPSAVPHGAAELPQPPGVPAGIGEGTSAARGASSGVTSPPDTLAPAPMQPPAATAGADGDGGIRSAPEAGTPSLTAAQRRRMAALLQQARAAGRQGKDAECLERLREAAAVPPAPAAR